MPLAKWRTTLAENDAVLVSYKVRPAEPQSRTLVRAFHGIDKSVVDTLKATIDATTEVVDPKADFETYAGTWRIAGYEVRGENSGDLVGSVTFIEELGSQLLDYASSNNKYVIRVRSTRYVQRENPWMFYERIEKRETTKWVNLSSSGITNSYDKLGVILTSSTTTATMVGDDYTSLHYYYNDAILYVDVAYGALTIGNYYLIASSQGMNVNYTALSNPRIEEALWEQERDKSYTFYRTLYTLSSPAIMRTFGIQYAGMVLTAAQPVEGNSTIDIDGLQNLTETIYANAKFRIGCDTYRVTANATAVNGAATVSVTPTVTAATEDAGDNAQVYFTAV